MCFSATASFVTGGALSAVGVVTLKKTRKKSELPLASIPLFFGIQQLIEGFLWLSFKTGELTTILTYIYSFFALILWPALLPWAIYLVETKKDRKKVLLPLVYYGMVVSFSLAFHFIINPIHADIIEGSIQYNYLFGYPDYYIIFYLLAVSASAFLSSSKILNLLGVLIVFSFFAAQVLFEATFPSVWCFFAAILSAVIYFYFKAGRKLITK